MDIVSQWIMEEEVQTNMQTVCHKVGRCIIGGASAEEYDTNNAKAKLVTVVMFN